MEARSRSTATSRPVRLVVRAIGVDLANAPLGNLPTFTPAQMYQLFGTPGSANNLAPFYFVPNFRNPRAEQFRLVHRRAHTSPFRKRLATFFRDATAIGALALTGYICYALATNQVSAFAGRAEDALSLVVTFYFGSRVIGH